MHDTAVAADIQTLPEELLQDIFRCLSKPELCVFSLTSRWGYALASPLIWRNVTLTDCRTRTDEGDDEHDDTPLIKKLIILATNPVLASHVQTLTHRCHLNTPSISIELPEQEFSSQTLSCDPRTIHLAKCAVKHLRRVHTLRIVYGHPNLNDVLVRGLFDRHRDRDIPVRKLWLESCRLPSACDPLIPLSALGLPLSLDFGHLESVRFRRMPIRPGRRSIDDDVIPRPQARHVLARLDTIAPRRSRWRYRVSTTRNEVRHEQSAEYQHPKIMHGALATLFGAANKWDDAIYARLTGDLTDCQRDIISAAHIESHHERNVQAYRGQFLDPSDLDELIQQNPHKKERYDQERERRPSNQVLTLMLSSASQTLTSLCFDWVSTHKLDDRYVQMYPWTMTFVNLFELRFPNLRAFQIRNAADPHTRVPFGFYLLDRCQLKCPPQFRQQHGIALPEIEQERLDFTPLKFLENHPQLQCLAWPMDRFFYTGDIPAEVEMRIDTVIETLGRTLVDLRIDANYFGHGEAVSENEVCPSIALRDSRRKFISHFASRMTRLKSIKLEGGIPRDERRECMRALHQCELEKLVLIGVISPIGNTWGLGGADVTGLVTVDDLGSLEGEDKASVWAIGRRDPAPVSPDFTFEPCYGWPAQAPMLHTIASFHAANVKELKICGFTGSPVLYCPTAITTPILAGLKHFHNLESLVFSVWLSLSYEGSLRDDEIVSFWLAAKDPNSMALVRVTDEEPEGWEAELRNKFAPKALAARLTYFIGPLLSHEAKSRKGGVHLRANFVMGENRDIFDMDVQIGVDSAGFSVCLGYGTPREEYEPERRDGKLNDRRWF